METVNKYKKNLVQSKVIEVTSEKNNRTQDQAAEPQVKIKRNYSSRRTFDTAYKLRILSAYDACETSLDRGALLRKEGLYHSRIAAWRQQLEHSKLKNGKKNRKALRTEHLTRENEQLKKKLAQAEAIIELQKKVSELLGTHILPHENSE